MSSQAIHDYLTKEINIERNIVTYRSLSRAMKIHVNVAKNELARYHVLAPFESQASKSAATYLLSGEALMPHARSYEDEDVDMDDEDEMSENEDSHSEGDVITRTRLMLVNERDLEVAKTQFMHLNSIHVYSLAPSPIRDAGLLCNPTDAIRLTDGQQGSKLMSVVGKVVGKNIRINIVPTKGKVPAQPIAGPSKTKIGTGAAPVTIAMEKATIKDSKSREDAKKNGKIKQTAKLSGRIEFAKAQIEEPKKTEPQETPIVQNKKTLEESRRTSLDKSSLKPSTDVRGKKRKSPMIMSSSDDDKIPSQSNPALTVAGSVRVKKRTILSDGEDQDGALLSARRLKKNTKASASVGSDGDDEVKALMDIDDDLVVHVTRDTSPVTASSTKDDEQDDKEVYDGETSDNMIVKVKHRKRREKKIIPMGTNGLKKKRVVKSRTMTDGKGYMVTEDYSSYESVEENEEPGPMTKGKTRRQSEGVKQGADSASTPAQKLRSTTTKALAGRTSKSKTAEPKQKSLAGFFTAPKPKNK